MDVYTIKLENNLEYLIIDTYIHKDQKYLVLVNNEDNNDMVLRKVIVKNNKEYLVKLDSNDEFEEIMALYSQKFRKEEENE